MTSSVVGSLVISTTRPMPCRAGFDISRAIAMRVDLFDFDLPEDNIALRPANPRDSARLLVVDPNANHMEDRIVSDLTSFLKPGDALVFNDTRVIPAQLEGVRLREGAPETAVSATLHMRADQSRWKAFARPGKRIKQGDRIRFGYERDSACGLAHLEATVEEKGEEGEITLLFDVSGPVLDEAIASVGHIPLPPYIAAKRPEDAQDQTDYQTIYAREGRRCRTNCRPAFHARSVCGAGRSRHRATFRDTSRWGRHLPSS